MTTAIIIAGLAAFFFFCGLAVATVACLTYYNVRFLRHAWTKLRQNTDRHDATDHRIRDCERLVNRLSLAVNAMNAALDRPSTFRTTGAEPGNEEYNMRIDNTLVDSIPSPIVDSEYTSPISSWARLADSEFEP